jgi:hypothetical protein
LKKGYPGDPEFAIDNYWKLPYLYVIQAVSNLGTLQREELHAIERPIAYLAYQNAEINRDRKKRSRPFKPDDFYWYDDQKMANMPEPRYGAAALKLMEMELFPSWALFVYRDLKARAADAFPPELLCYQCDDVIILAPSIEGNTLDGMLIAAGTASGELRELRSPQGHVVTVRMPTLDGEFVADEEASCQLLA